MLVKKIPKDSVLKNLKLIGTKYGAIIPSSKIGRIEIIYYSYDYSNNYNIFSWTFYLRIDSSYFLTQINNFSPSELLATEFWYRDYFSYQTDNEGLPELVIKRSGTTPTSAVWGSTTGSGYLVINFDKHLYYTMLNSLKIEESHRPEEDDRDIYQFTQYASRPLYFGNKLIKVKPLVCRKEGRDFAKEFSLRWLFNKANKFHTVREGTYKLVDDVYIKQ